MLDELREWLADIPGLIVQVQRFQDGPPVGSPLEVEVLSSDPELGERSAKQLVAFMEQQEGLINIESTLPVREMAWEIEVDKVRAASMGVSLAEIGVAVQMVTEGVKVDEYLPADSNDTVDILVRLQSEQRTLAQLDRMLVQTATSLVPLSSFVEVKPTAAQRIISRFRREVCLYRDRRHRQQRHHPVRESGGNPRLEETGRDCPVTSSWKSAALRNPSRRRWRSWPRPPASPCS